MTPTELVLIDTCVWVPFFNRPQSAEKAAVDGLLDEDRATLIGPILAEVLQGFRRDAATTGQIGLPPRSVGYTMSSCHGRIGVPQRSWDVD